MSTNTNNTAKKLQVFGLKGKSAYEYAKEGGYIGTEEEFRTKLAKEYYTYDELHDKPFGEEKVCDIIFENVELTSTDQFVTGSNTAYVILNGPVKVIYNDVEYIFEEDGNDFGDRKLVNYPFYINCYKDGRWIIRNENPGDIISLYATKTVINQLDEKFIPDTIARIPDWDVSATDSTNRIDNKPFGKVLEFVKQTKDYYQPSDGTITWSLYSSLTPPFKIIHNGNEYVFDTFPFGDETFTKYPFYVSCTRVTIAGGTSMLVYKVQTLNAEDVIEFYSTEEVEKKLEKKYLPATYVETVNGNTPDENGNVELESCKWEDIQDKPFGEINEWNPVFENVELTNTSQRITGSHTETSLVMSCKFPVKIIYNGDEYVFTELTEESAGLGDDSFAECPFFVTGTSENSDWYIYNQNVGDVISVYVTKTINQLDEAYIPDTIARTADIPTIPTQLSAFENDSKFITNTVDNLTNYYLKSETYTQDEVKALISAIPKFSIQVVDILPTEDISTTTVYLVKSVEETDNLYTEYIYVNGAWECLGKQIVDLSGYAFKADVLAKDNTEEYTPSEDYHPATKKYVDESIESIPSDVFIFVISDNDYETGYDLVRKINGDTVTIGVSDVFEAYDSCKHLVVFFYTERLHLTNYSSDSLTFGNTDYTDHSVVATSFVFYRSTGNIIKTSRSIHGIITEADEYSALSTTDKTIIGAIKELNSTKLSLPTDSEGNVLIGTAGQVLVSDGDGGFTWTTISTETAEDGNEVTY